VTGVAIAIERLANARDLPLPAYATEGAAGFDVAAAVDGQVVVAPGDRLLVPTGIRMALPPGYEGQVRPRSGLALRHGLTILNSPGTIDSDYRGEVGVILVNLGAEPVTIRRGDRIAQIVIARHEVASWREEANLPDSRRGAGGFGSTGVVPATAADGE
jgi:dUTP pyrophosphatase